MGRKRLDDACSRGHPRTRTNTYVQPDGKRICRICRALALHELRKLGRHATERAARRDDPLERNLNHVDHAERRISLDRA